MEHNFSSNTTPFDLNTLPFEVLEYINKLTADNTELHKQNESLSKEVDVLKWNLEEFYRQIYGKKSEKFVHHNPYQPSLFDTGTHSEHTESDTSQIEVKYKRKRKKKQSLPLFKGRFPDWLPREDAGILELPAESIPCPDCGTVREPFTYKIVERLAYKVQSSLVVKEYKIPVYRCPECTDSIVSMPAPATPLENIQVESSFYAYILSEKFEYGLPLYRVEKRLGAQKLPMTRTTLCEYQVQIAELLKPLAECLFEHMLSSGFLHIDETKWQVARTIAGKRVYCNACGWMFLSKEGDVAMNYGVSRKKTSLSELMPGYKGIIVCDGAPHYDHYRIEYETPLARCNAHARRRFEKALKSHPAQAQYVLRIYALVYRREDYIVTHQNMLNDEQIQRLRKRQRWLFAKLKEFCDTHEPSTLPKSPLGKAMRYFQRYFKELVFFCNHISIPIDNNPCERMIRKFVIGRKAWLFSASEIGAYSAATIYSLVLTCMNNNIPVVEYLDDVIHRIGVLKDTNYQTMLPQVWKKVQEAQKSE